MKAFGITDKGKIRTENQDSFVIEACVKRGMTVAVICDGMGGAKAGDLASRLACKEFVSHVYDAVLDGKMRNAVSCRRILSQGCDEANGVVFEYSRFDPDYNGMGTTLVGGVITRRRAYLVNIGDSRAYHLSRFGIKQISKDHSYVQELVDSGTISHAEAKVHPKKNIITRALGVDRKVKSDFFEQPLRFGDAILLCSDGLSNTVSDSEMLSAYRSEKTPELICRGLLELALERGARDNVSVAVVKL